MNTTPRDVKAPPRQQKQFRVVYTINGEPHILYGWDRKDTEQQGRELASQPGVEVGPLQFRFVSRWTLIAEEEGR